MYYTCQKIASFRQIVSILVTYVAVKDTFLSILKV